LCFKTSGKCFQLDAYGKNLWALWSSKFLTFVGFRVGAHCSLHVAPCFHAGPLFLTIVFFVRASSSSWLIFCFWNWNSSGVWRVQWVSKVERLRFFGSEHFEFTRQLLARDLALCFVGCILYCWCYKAWSKQDNLMALLNTI